MKQYTKASEFIAKSKMLLIRLVAIIKVHSQNKSAFDKRAPLAGGNEKENEMRRKQKLVIRYGNK